MLQLCYRVDFLKNSGAISSGINSPLMEEFDLYTASYLPHAPYVSCPELLRNRHTATWHPSCSSLNLPRLARASERPVSKKEAKNEKDDLSCNVGSIPGCFSSDRPGGTGAQNRQDGYP